ncbi:hypothetical protein BSKO_11445 [Bryopsis sp. KO-2023]|nr:hypothetical protein BSKO_11445 [Bryopsis sp. KO-2023]
MRIPAGQPLGMKWRTTPGFRAVKTGLRRRFQNGRRFVDKLPGGPLHSPIVFEGEAPRYRQEVRCSKSPSGTRLVSSLTSLEDDDDFDFVDLAGEHGLKAPKSRAMYEVLRLDKNGKHRKIFVKRRDLLRNYGLMPRDIRRIDPALDRAHSAETIVIKEQALLLSLGGVRCIVAPDKCLLFESQEAAASKFLDVVTPRLKSAAGRHYLKELSGGPLSEYVYNGGTSAREHESSQAFELDILEAALIIATGKLDAELVVLMKRARSCLNKLPSQINPINLEELRRTKQASVELESKAETLVELLNEVLDDEEELAEINLSSQPLRDARQKRRERNRLKREHLASGAIFLHERKELDGCFSRTKVSFQDAQDALEKLEDDEEEEEDIEKVEDMLEYYLQRASATQNQAERVLAGARDLEESIGVSLSARRFEVNRLELLLSMGSFAACLGAMIAGIFGMNMRNTMELSVWGFYGVTGGILLMCILIFILLLRYTRRKSIV